MANNLTDVGNDIGGFLGGLLNPVIGTTKTTETQAPSEAITESKRTGTIVIAVLAVVTLAVVAYLLIKKS